MMFRPLPTEDFEVHSPITIFEQKADDECTSCAISAIAEDVLRIPIDSSFLYQNSKDSEFGIKPRTAIKAVLSKGVKTQYGTVVLPFYDYSRVWGFSLFNECRKEMYHNNVSLFVGIQWQPEWTFITDGIVSMVDKWVTYMPHAVKVFGQKNINGIIYLKVQNSEGVESGDNGVWYFPKEVADKFSFVYKLT